MKPLRVGLLCDRRGLPEWVIQSLRQAEASGLAEWTLTLEIPSKPPTNPWYDLYIKIDRIFFPFSPDAFRVTSLKFLSTQRPILSWTGQDITSQDLDVLYDPFSLSGAQNLESAAKFGVWAIHFGSDPVRSQSVPGLQEMARGDYTSSVHLDIRSSGPTTRAVFPTIVPTHRRSAFRHANDLAWKASTFLERQLRIHSNETLNSSVPTSSCHVDQRRLAPGSADILRVGLRVIGRLITDTWEFVRFYKQWSLAYQWNASSLDVKSLAYLIPPPDRFWADPFVLQVENQLYLFYEEARYTDDKGTIVVSRIDPNGRPEAPILILERDYHLSYPSIFHWNGTYYMTVETTQRRQLELYRCTSFPLKWEFDRVLLTDILASDPTIFFAHQSWWLFTNVAYPHAQDTEALHLYHADSPLGPWIPHRLNPVKSDVRSLRPAGPIFEREGSFYRPAQDCSRRYGYAVSINRILRLTPEDFEEEEVEKISPDWNPNIIGVHTYNKVKELTVIDFIQRRRGRLFQRLRDRLT